MDTARLLTQLPLIMGLSSAALMLIFIISLSTPLTTLCVSSSPYSLPAIKSMCVEYICSMWSLLHHPSDQQPDLFSTRNLFLLVNIIILVLLINMHLQQQTAGKRSSRRKKHPRPENLIEDEKASAPLQVSSLADDHAAPEVATDMDMETLSASPRSAELDADDGEAATMQVSDVVQEIPAVESGRVNGSDTEKIVLDEDGRLRLISEPIFCTACTTGTEGGDAESRETGQLELVDSGNGVDSEEEEDGQLGLIDAVKGSDAVPDEVGRLRSIPRPARRPRKSHSTGDKDVDEPSAGNHLNNNSDSHTNLDDFNYDSHTRSLSHSNYQIHEDSLSNPLDSPDNLNYDSTSNLNELNNGALVIDLSSSPSIPESFKKEDTPSQSVIDQNFKKEEASPQSSSRNKSSSLRRTGSRPMRVKKSDSLDATWKAISSNRGSGANSIRDSKHLLRQSSRENKHLIRQSSRENKHLISQSSRQDFKPGGRGRASSVKVRREPSIGQEELNAKVESFIAKFNEQIRIQRQQSILSYMQMVDRGSA